MAHLIDKDALVAEIERLRKEDGNPYFPSETADKYYARGVHFTYDGLVNFLDTIEVKEIGVDLGDPKGDKSAKYIIDTKNLKVKEVDLEKEIENCLKQHRMLAVGKKDFSDIAKHFFELGLKVQHDNWKVVDNINPPQADRNKIYCVFTKNRYILAIVINHPKDEELLQWKCTEFPNHRYDMCEGDKYIQIV